MSESSVPELSVLGATLHPPTTRELSMSMEMVAWHSMYQAAHAYEERRPFSRATLSRIAGST